MKYLALNGEILEAAPGEYRYFKDMPIGTLFSFEDGNRSYVKYSNEHHGLASNVVRVWCDGGYYPAHTGFRPRVDTYPVAADWLNPLLGAPRA